MNILLEAWILYLLFSILIIVVIVAFVWEMKRQYRVYLQRQKLIEERQKFIAKQKRISEAKERAKERKRLRQLEAKRAEQKQNSRHDNRRQQYSSYYSNSADNISLEDIGRGLKNVGRGTGEAVKDLGGKAVNVALIGVGLVLLGKFSGNNSGGKTRVKSYRKSDGTFVRSHTRRYK